MKIKIPEISDLIGYSNVYELDFDALAAIRIFGGKSMEEAFEYICSEDECDYAFLESFRFMRKNAFWFYFPILGKYLNWDTQKNEEVDIVVVKTSLRFLLEKKSELFLHLKEIIELIDVFENLIFKCKIEYPFEFEIIKEIKYDVGCLKKYLLSFEGVHIV